MDYTLFNIIGYVVSWLLLGALASRYGIDSGTDDKRSNG